MASAVSSAGEKHLRGRALLLGVAAERPFLWSGRKLSCTSPRASLGSGVSGGVIGSWDGPRGLNFKDIELIHTVRVVLKYRHCDGNLCIKVTDDVACLLYRTDQAQDVKKIEKFHSQLMRLMVAKESRSAAMETD